MPANPNTVGPSRRMQGPWISLVLLALVGILVVVLVWPGGSSDSPGGSGSGGSSSGSRSGVVKPIDAQVLVGRWNRGDDKFIVVTQVYPDGRVDAQYFNPSPKKVSKATIRRDGQSLGLFVEITDVDYPGATYTLTYSPGNRSLHGTYSQPQLGQSFPVEFTKDE